MKLLLAVWAIAQVCGMIFGQSASADDCGPCTKKLELGIVLDSSSSISREDFRTAKRFLQDYIKKFVVGPDGVRVSLITYGVEVHPENSFNLTTYNNNYEVEEAIGEVPHRATTYTATGLGIRFMRDQQLAARFARAGVPRVGLVITDGNSQEPEVTEAEARRARDDGIQLFAVGVGHKIDHTELLNIAGYEDQVDRVENYDKLKTITDWLAKYTCKGRQ